MKKSYKPVAVFVLAFVLLSCESRTNETEIDTTAFQSEILDMPVALDTVPKVYSCYEGIIRKDTVELSLAIADDSASGNLHYKYFEKDENRGFVKGKLFGDTLIGNYFFQAEGVRSAREVVFLTKNNIVYEGFGEVFEKDGKTVYKDKSKLNFTKSLALKNVNCE